MSDVIEVPVSDRFQRAAEQWAEERVMADDAALEAKAEQALLEIEHLVSGAHDVNFEVEDGAIRHEPSEDLLRFLAAQAEKSGTDPETVLGLYVDLFAGAFLEDEGITPD